MAHRRRQSAGRKNQRTPGWIWLLAGILIGLGLAYYLSAKGYVPQPQADPSESEESAATGSPSDAEEVAPAAVEQKKSRYDFFTVLPEMEVVVPEQELGKKSLPQVSQPADSGSYLLQVGSFRENSDAEQMKARLALLGIMARIQIVTVNEATWHRVRVGPVSGIGRADEMRSQLSANGIDSLVMKSQ